MKNIAILIACFALLAACQPPPTEAYYNRGEPENLLDVSTEVVNMSLTTRTHVVRLSNAVIMDPPSRAELDCAPADPLCEDAKIVLGKMGVPVRFTGESGQAAALIYERVIARDCDPAYYDNSQNPYNLPPASFGCANAANMVQQVSDKRQFVAPALMDFPPAEEVMERQETAASPPSPSGPPARPTVPPKPPSIYVIQPTW